MPRIIVFDVNETLLDLGALLPRFEDVFGDPAVLEKWFNQVLKSAWVATLSDAYRDFGVIGAAALEIVALRQERSLSAADRSLILEGMRSLPPHPEVPAALARLKEAGYRMVTLTNSPPQALQAQLENAGIAHYFERALSVDSARRFKPHPAAYQVAVDQLGTAAHNLRMVAAHDWDVSGAIRAGWQAAFIARPGMVLGPDSERPDVIGPDLDAVVEQILRVEATNA